MAANYGNGNISFDSLNLYYNKFDGLTLKARFD